MYAANQKILPEDSDYGEELEGVCVVDVRGHLLQEQVDVEAQRRHVVDNVHTAKKIFGVK